MQTKQGNMLQSLQDVGAFLEEHADRLGDVINSGTRQRLADAIADLAGHVSEQTGSNINAQGATKKQLALRHALLRDHMTPIAQIAKAELPQTPEIEPLRMPKGKPTAQRLAAAAYGMAQSATPHAALFVAAGLPKDFVARLTAATDAMVASVAERSKSRGKRSGATQGLTARLTAGRKIVHVLDAFVKSALKDDPALLRNWNVVKRVRKSTAHPVAAIVATTAALEASPPSPITLAH